MEIKEELKNLIVSSFVMIGSGIAFYIKPITLFFVIYFGMMIVNFAYCYKLYNNKYFETKKDVRLVQSILGFYLLIMMSMLLHYII